jgi:hypothetical protein
VFCHPDHRVVVDLVALEPIGPFNTATIEIALGILDDFGHDAAVEVVEVGRTSVDSAMGRWRWQDLYDASARAGQPTQREGSTHRSENHPGMGKECDLLRRSQRFWRYGDIADSLKCGHEVLLIHQCSMRGFTSSEPRKV